MWKLSKGLANEQHVDWLNGPSLDNGNARRGRNNAVQPEAVDSQQSLIFRLRSLQASGHQHHVQVDQLGERRSVASRHNMLSDQVSEVPW